MDGRTTINDVMTVSGRSVRINVPIETSEVRLRGQSSAANLTANNMEHVIISAWIDPSTNSLKLRPLVGDVVTFKKATSISGSWSGSTGTTATFTYQTDDTSIPAGSTYLELRQSGSYVVAYDPSGAPRARVSAGGSSYSHNSVLVYDHFDYDDEYYYYRSEDLITRQSSGASKTVYYN